MLAGLGLGLAGGPGPVRAGPPAGWRELGRAGVQAFQEGDYRKAERFLVAAARQASRRGDRDPALAASLRALGELRMEGFRYQKAVSVLERAVSILAALPADQELQLARTRLVLGTCLTRMQRYPEAERALTAAAAGLEGRAGAAVRLAEARTARAEFELMRAEGAVPETAAGLLQQARETFEAEAPGTTSHAEVLTTLGLLFMAQEKPEDALWALNGAREILERVYRPEHPKLAEPLQRLGVVHHARGAHAEAAAAFRRVRALRRKILEPDHPELGSATFNLAESLAAAGACEEADETYRWARDLATRTRGARDPLAALIEKRRRACRAEAP